MAKRTIDVLQSLLRGELSAVETYKQGLDKLKDTTGAGELRRILDDHIGAANALRLEIQKHGGQPSQGAGAWGAFAKAVEGTAKLLGNDAALKALKEGEEHGIKEYESALNDKELLADCMMLIRSKLLPQARAHIPVLDRLMAGLVQRIRPEQAKQSLSRGALLVCAYDDPEKCRQYHLEGAISLEELEAREDSLPKEKELIFYCA